MLFLFLATFNAGAQELVPFQKNGKFGFKKDTQVIIPATYEAAKEFTEGLARVKIKGLWGFIDTTGKLKISAIYQKAEPFDDDVYAPVVFKGKTGLIDSNGTYIISPQFDKISYIDRGYSLHKGKNIGFFAHGDEKMVPAVYVDLEIKSVFVNAKLPTGLWDLYHEGKLKLQNMDAPVEMYWYENGLMLVSIQGKKGLFSLYRGWVFPALYSRIEPFDFPEYVIDDQKYGCIYALYTVDDFTVDIYDPNDYSYLELAKANGELIVERKFFRLSSYVDPDLQTCKPCMIAQSTENKVTVLNMGLEMSELNYSSIFPHMDWYVASSTEKSYILDQNLQPIDSFQRIRRYQEIDYDNYDELFDVTYRDVYNEPFLVVSNTFGDSTNTAIYELNEEKIISPWFKDEFSLEVIRDVLINNTVYIFHGEPKNKYGYFTRGMKAGTPAVYERCEVFGSNFIITKKIDEDFCELYYTQSDSLIKILQAPEINPSSELRFVEFIENPDDPDGRDEMIDAFSNPFLYAKWGENQFEVICQNGKKVGPFDLLIPHASLNDFISTQKNGKFGVVNLRTGDQIAPFHTERLVMDYNGDNFNEYRTQIGEGETAYYLNGKGKKFYTLSPEVVIFKEKGLYGFKSASDFTGNTETVVPAIYKEITKDAFSNMFIVKDKNKKYGIIDHYGDTLINFKYTKIENTLNDNYLDGQIFYTFNKTKVGLVSEFRGELIPPLYDKIKSFSNSSRFFNAFEVEKNEKKGLFSGNVEIMPCNYDEIYHFVEVENNYRNYFVGRKGNKYYAQLTILQDLGFQKYAPLVGPYDLIEGNFGFNYDGGELAKHELPSGKFLEKVNSTNGEFSNGYFKIVFRNGKWGALGLDGKELIPLIYESATFMDYRNEVMIGIENGVKYYIYVDNNERFTEDQW